jgi:integrase
MQKTISARTIETAKPKEKPYSIAIGEGLILLINPSGSKWWRFRYRHLGKAKMLSLGVYPDVGLADAKQARDEARKLVAQGIDPSEKRKEAKVVAKLENATTFKAVAEEWMKRHPAKSTSTANKNNYLLGFAFAAFGDQPITKITPPMVLAVCREEEDKQHHETAHRIKAKCSQVFRYAVATGRLERDPTTDLRGALAPYKPKVRAALVEPTQVAQLMRDIHAYTGYFTTQCALKLAPLVFIRPGELRAAVWADIDFDAAEWRYTPPKTRNQTELAHIVPLSTQALQILRELHQVTGSGAFLFPKLTDMKKCMSENTINGALRRMGYTSDQMCGHGFRAIARTILDEVLDFPIEHIEQQLAHQVRDMHGRAYNRTKHLLARRKMMQAWADYLDKLKAGASITHIEKSA